MEGEGKDEGEECMPKKFKDWVRKRTWTDNPRHGDTDYLVTKIYLITKVGSLVSYLSEMSVNSGP